MRTIPGGRRTSRGLVELRKRYVRRAESLCSNPEFIDATIQFRRRWNADHPQYAIRTSPDEAAPTDTPARLIDAIRRYVRFDGEKCELPIELIQGAEAWGEWETWTRGFSAKFFPPVDFPNPPAPEAITSNFICAALQQDPRLLGSCDQFFDDFHESFPELITVKPSLLPERSLFDRVAKQPDEQPVLCLPLYPGITPKDLQDNASKIAEQAALYYGDQTVDARAQTLRASGCTNQQIADRLGLTLRTVENIFQSHD